MINFWLKDFLNAEAAVELLWHGHLLSKEHELTVDDRKTIKETLLAKKPVFVRLGIQAAAQQIDDLVNKIDWGIPLGRDELSTTLGILTTTIHNGTQSSRFYHYPNDKADVLETFKKSWRSVFKAFPSTKGDIEAGIDLWALGHSTAAVFHMMRAAEIALRVLARERRVSIGRGKPLEWATWGKLLGAVETKVREIHNRSNGPRKDAALNFYATALGHMTALKDKYRDQVSHVRREYDEHEALSAINHVREMLIVLASKLDESSTKSIAWGLR